MAETGAPHHHGIHAVAVEGLAGLFGGGDVPVADDGDLHARILLHLADQGPVRLALVELAAGAAVDGERGDTGILQPLGQRDDDLALLVPSEPGLDRDGQLDGLHHPAGDLHHLVGLAHHAAARPAPGDLVDRTAEVDVDQIRTGLRRPHGRLHHRVGQMAVDLDADGPLVVVEPHLGDGLGRVADQPVRRDELGEHQLRAEALADVAERDVGHVFHRGEEDGAGAECEVSDLHFRAR